ncbi:MAG: glycosyltransferase, partial [Pseudomonadota bacterium]
MLYPFSWANDPQRRLAAAAGGSMLVRRAALDAAGGLAPIRGDVIDDCALARLMKRQGPTWVGLARRSRSLRPYDGLEDVWRMVARTAYVQLQRNPLILLGCVFGLGLVFLAPPLALIGGLVAGDIVLAALGAAAWAAMAVSVRPMQAAYGLKRFWTISLPAAAALYLAMTIDSGQRDWRGLGNAWKGRAGGGAAA